MDYTYYLSKTETEQWHSNALVDHRPARDGSDGLGCNYPTQRKYCRDLIEDIAKDRGSVRIVDHEGVPVA